MIGVSDHVGREIRDRGFPPDKVRVIENALVLERFAAAGETRAEFRRRLGLDAGERVVVSFGWPPDRKGVDVLLDGVARARAEDPAIRLLLVGEREQLETFAAQRLGRLPEWLTVIAPVEDVGSLMGASDAFVSAARTEGFGFAIGEAMACGLPVVGSDTPGTAHFARSPSFLEYPCEDAAALAARLRAALGPDAKAAIGEPGRRWALANLGMDRYLDEVLECYRSVLA